MKDNNGLLGAGISYFLFALLGWLCVFVSYAVGALTKAGDLKWSLAFAAAGMLIALAGAVIGATICFLLRKHFKAQGKQIEENHILGMNSRHRSIVIAGLSSFAVCALVWFTMWMAFYPGICAYDSYIQVNQIADGMYTDHHPIVHTLLIKLCMIIGENMMANVNSGMGLYTFLQMMALAGCVSYGVAFVYQFEKRRWPVALVIGVIALSPMNAYMSVSVTKDIVFTIFLMLQLIAMMWLIKGGSKIHYVIYTVGAMGVTVFRNNGKYALALLLVVMAVFAFITKEKVLKKLLSCGVSGLIIGSLIVAAAFRLVGAVQGDKREMLSVPIQQLARVMNNQQLSEADAALIGDFEADESYLLYRMDIADPVKRHVNTSVALSRAKEFIPMYVRLFGEYPQDYVNAFLGLNAGILDVRDETHAAINLSETEWGLGYIQTRWQEIDLNPNGIYKASKWTGFHEVLEEWAATNGYLNIPVLKYLMMPGIYLWLVLLCVVIAIVRKAYKRLLPMVMLLAYYGTMLFGPTVQLRYVFPVMILIPFIIFFVLEESEFGNSN